MASVQIVSPAPGGVVAGVVEIRVRVTGGRSVSGVRVLIGPAESGTRPARPLGGGEYGYRWDSRLRLDGKGRYPADAMFWITAKAQVDGIELTSSYLWVLTGNSGTSQGASQSPGWRPELAWEANYRGTFANWKSSNFATIGSAYASLRDDPVLGRQRRVIRASVPETARLDRDQPGTTTVRFQSSSPRRIIEGDEFCVGFAYYTPSNFPRVYPHNDRTNPRGRRGTAFISIFQFYGPPYVQGSPLVLHANRRVQSDPIDEFAIRGNELNPGDPMEYLALPYLKGRWTDVVLRIRASATVERGWIETYVNQGESTSVRPVRFVNGQYRMPRVLLRPNSAGFGTDMQLYRVARNFAQVTLWHTGHKIARTVAEADPRSYRNGPLAVSADGQEEA